MFIVLKHFILNTQLNHNHTFHIEDYQHYLVSILLF